MSDAVTIDGLASAIVDAAHEYTEDVTAAIPDIVLSNTKAALSDLRGRSPVLTRSYARGWTSKKIYSRDGFVGYIIHNRTDYQLAHLLEFGHAKKGGGRVEGHRHIAPVADEYGAKLAADLGRMVVRGGAQ